MNNTTAIPDSPERDFEQFLLSLDQDRDRAAEKYEALRHRLIKFFVWNNSSRAEELADHTLVILERKTQSERIGNAWGYALAIARNVQLEASEEARRTMAVEDLPRGEDSLVDPQDNDRGVTEEIDGVIRAKCLKDCLDKLSADDHMVAIEYYRAGDDKLKTNRKRLAEIMDITRNALAVRAIRIRERLEKCVLACLENRRRAILKAYGAEQV
jgi:DNA-directed RNA polymerase specialized sigma24 family protein